MDLPLLLQKKTLNVGKKSWSELKTTVNDLRRQLATLSSMVPTSISFRSLSDGRTRIYFLGTPPNGWETTLLYTDIPPTDIPTSQRYTKSILLSKIKEK